MDPLFPVVNKSSLFPVCNNNETASNTSSDVKLDWLQNKSFPSLSFEAQRLQEQREDSVTDQKQKIIESSDETADNTDDKTESRKRKKKKKHKHKNKKKKSHKREASRSPSPPIKIKPKITESQGNKVFIEELPYLEPEDAFRIDRKANIHNWKYESLYKGHIAAFPNLYRTTLGGETCMRDHKHKDKEKTRRYFSRESKRLTSQAPMTHLLPNKDSRQIETNFIPLPPETRAGEKSSGEKGENVDIRERLMDDSTSHYVKGVGVVTEDQDVCLTETEQRLNKKTAEFNRRTREEPHNVDLWLEFLEFQDTVLRYPESEGHFKITKAAVLEKKIAIIKKAMDVNQGNITLKLKYLQLCRGAMEADEVNKEMENLIFHNPTNISLWNQYLLFNQSRLASFSVSKMCKLYQKCITTLVKYLEGKLTTHTLPQNLSNDLLDIFVRLCSFLKQAGHKEKAVAAFQAMIELNMCCPDRLKSAELTDKTIILESFWDSGLPRFGEEGARGWSFWMDNKDLLPTDSENSEKDSSVEEEEQLILQQEKEKWEAWLQIETLRESVHWLPWKPNLTEGETMDDCEDIDRLVLFDDISHFLFCVPENMTSRLLIEFLNFLGFDNCQGILEVEQENGKLKQIFDIFGLEDFKRSHLLQERAFLHKFIGNTIQQGLLKFQGDFHTKLAILWLRYQAQNEDSKKVECKKFKKTARNVLKDPTNRNSKATWLEYSQLLSSLGGQKDAIEVLEMAIPMLCTDNDSEKEYIPAFYRNLVENVLNFPVEANLFQLSKNHVSISAESVKKCVHVLTCFCENRHSDLKNPDSTSAVSKLKSRRKMEEKLDLLLQDHEKDTSRSKEEWNSFLATSQCCALFEYVFSDLNLDSALCVLNKVQCKVFNSMSSLTSDNNQSVLNQKLERFLEQIFRFKIQIIHHHMCVHHSSLGPLRETVEAALEIFPDHVYFLHVFTELEKGSMVFGRLDRFFGHYIGRASSPVLTVFAVASLIKRQKQRTELSSADPEGVPSHAGSAGLMNKIRSYLERSLELPDLEHCSILWNMYLYCERSFGLSERASGLFYRSLQLCPWVKDLYLDGVTIFKDSKLEEITDLMMEKEIRLQIPLEEMDILQQ